MSEKMNFSPEVSPQIENTEGLELSDVVFSELEKKGGKKEYRSSAPGRKIIILSDSSVPPSPGFPHRVRVVEDTNPEDPESGKLIVEIIPIEVDSIEETETHISYLGVKLEKAEDSDSQFVPDKEKYADFINDKDVALPLQRDIAVAFLNGDPIVIDGGTSLGKTTTVRKMAAELGYEVHYANLNGATDVEDLMGRYIPNPHRTNPEDPEYIFADGKVTSGLRQEEGKIKVVILDEFNASAPNILIRLHEVLDALERGGEVILSEDASEAVLVDKGKTKVIALMNPPGKGYFGREPLDPAQLRRWVYKKMPSELPSETFSYATDALFGLEVPEAEVSPEMILESREHALTPEQLHEIPGIQEILEKYKEFHKAAKELVKNRRVAEDQPQPFTYDDRMEPRRVRDFVLRFYNGDINQTFQNALRYYYANKLETEADRRKLGELIRLVEAKNVTVRSKRKGFERSANPEKSKLIDDIEKIKSEIKASGKLSGLEGSSSPETILAKLEMAQEILGDDFMGPEKIEKTFGIKLNTEDIPDMPYSAEDLETAKENGEMLVLGIDKDIEGNPLTISRMIEMIPEVIDPATGRKVKVLYSQKSAGESELNDTGWYKNETFFTGLNPDGTPSPEATPRLRWRLTSKAPLPESVTTGYGGTAERATNYIEQTRILRDHLLTLGALTEEEALGCSDEILREIETLMGTNQQEAAKKLSELKINKNHRRVPAEVVYDILLSIKGNGDRILENVYDWTSTVSSDGYLVIVGGAGSDGARVGGWGPVDRIGGVGVVSLR